MGFHLAQVQSLVDLASYAMGCRSGSGTVKVVQSLRYCLLGQGMGYPMRVGGHVVEVQRKRLVIGTVRRHQRSRSLESGNHRLMRARGTRVVGKETRFGSLPNATNGDVRQSDLVGDRRLGQHRVR